MTKDDISSWKSCQHITHNLSQSYRQAFIDHDLQYFRVKEDLSYFSAFKYAGKIKELKVDLIVWLDHKPCASLVLNALNEVFKDVSHHLRPKFLIHLFGDFVLDCLQWEFAEDAINHYPVHFIVASDAQKKIVDKFFKSQKKIVSVIAFPVDENVFSLDNQKKNRAELRASFGLQDELVLIYTGRVSFQKNVHTLIKTLDKVNEIIDKKFELWIVGPWDDLLLPYYGINGMVGSYFKQMNPFLFAPEYSNVRFLGNFEAEELVKYYQAADLFISFSTFNDEDYGMSAAEALMTGLPCVLSNWGGYSSFSNYSDEIELIPIEYKESRMQVQTPAAQKIIMKKLMLISQDEYSRKENSKKAGEHLSIFSIAGTVGTLIEAIDYENNVQFSGLFYKLCGLFSSNPESPFKNNITVYKEIYGDYDNCRI